MKSLAESRIKAKRESFKKFLRRKTEGMETGIPGLDRYLLGLGGFVSIQGETSCNKSTLGLQIAHHNLKQGRPCIVLDKENGDGRIISRLMCQANNISETDLKVAAPADRIRMWNQVAEYPLHLHTEPIGDCEEVAERVKEALDIYKRPVTLLVDSVQALDPIADDQRVSLERWVYFFDRLKVEYEGRLTIIMISEKNRMSYGQAGVGGGKGSNVTDYKPETVLDIRWKEGPDTYVIKVSKHRDGMRGEEFELTKVLSKQSNKRSFVFLLEEVETEVEI